MFYTIMLPYITKYQIITICSIDIFIISWDQTKMLKDVDG